MNKEIPRIERVATSIKINPEVWKKAKIEAIKEDIDLSLLVEQALEEYIDEQARKGSKR